MLAASRGNGPIGWLWAAVALSLVVSLSVANSHSCCREHRKELARSCDSAESASRAGSRRHCAHGGRQTIDTAQDSNGTPSRQPRVTPLSVFDTAHDSAAAIDMNGCSRVCRLDQGSHPACVHQARHACGDRCNSAGNLGASPPDRRTSRTACGRGIRAGRCQSVVPRMDARAARTGRS
jgi:hypothetical protein